MFLNQINVTSNWIKLKDIITVESDTVYNIQVVSTKGDSMAYLILKEDNTIPTQLYGNRLALLQQASYTKGTEDLYLQAPVGDVTVVITNNK